MKKIFALTIFCMLFISYNGYSQKSYSSAQYNIGFATGDLSEFISQASFRGAVIEYRTYMKENLMVGIDVGWNVFYERKDYDTYTRNTISISGIQYNYSNQVPILVALDYMIKRDEKVNPYVGLGLGTMYSRRETDMGMYSYMEDAWHFALKPELGLLYDLNPSNDLKISAKYLIGFGAGNLETQSFISIGVGLAFKQY